MFRTIKYITPIFLIAIANFGFAQQDTSLTREVEVVKAFNPTISDANKIYEMPKIEEEEHQKPSFNYSIFSQPIMNTFSVNTLKAASIASTPKKETGYGLIKAGFGNYNKPYGEVFFNHLFSKKSIFGLHGMHLSSLGKITLEGGDKVKAPFSKNEAEIYVKHLFRTSVLTVSADINHDGFTYYGYPKKAIPEFLKEENQDINYQGTKQAFTKGGFNLSLKNPTAEMDEPKVDLDFNYHYFGTKTKQREHYAEIATKIRKPFNTGSGILDAGIMYNQSQNVLLSTETLELGKVDQTWIYAKPAYYIGGDIANIRIGFNAWFIMNKSNDAQAKVTPNVRLNFAPVKNIINLFAGIDGDLMNNHYSKVAYENPFVDPEHNLTNSFEKFRFYGGFDGKFSTKTNFKIAVDYSIIEDQNLYYLQEGIFLSPTINPNPTMVDNTFKVLYDNMDRLKFNAEVFHTSSDKIDLLLKGNYYIYKMATQDHAWNLPDWDATLSLKYNVSDRLSVSTDVFLIGSRKALIIENENNPLSSSIPAEPLLKIYNLDTAFDLNLRGNYKITQNFSVFAQLNNFGFQKYERWFGYPVQSFNFLAGASYAF